MKFGEMLEQVPVEHKPEVEEVLQVVLQFIIESNYENVVVFLDNKDPEKESDKTWH